MPCFLEALAAATCRGGRGPCILVIVINIINKSHDDDENKNDNIN
jgi:hypothetical protein